MDIVFLSQQIKLKFFIFIFHHQKRYYKEILIHSQLLEFHKLIKKFILDSNQDQ